MDKDAEVGESALAAQIRKIILKIIIVLFFGIAQNPFSTTSEEGNQTILTHGRNWHLPALKLSHRLSPSSHATGVAWSPDSGRIASYGEWSNLITIWTRNGELSGRIARLTDHYVGNALAFVNDGSEMVARPLWTSPDATIAASVYDATVGKVIHDIQGPSGASAGSWAMVIAVSNDGTHVAIITRYNQPVILFELPSWNKIAELKVEQPLALAFSRDGERLAVGLAHDVKIYDIRNIEAMQTVSALSRTEDGCCIRSISFDESGKRLLVSKSGYPAQDCLKDCKDRKSCCRLVMPGSWVKVINLDGQTPPILFPGMVWPIWDAAWSPDGKFVAFVTYDGLYFWDASNPHEYSKVANERQTLSLGFSPDGRLIALAGQEGVSIYEIIRK